MLSYEKNLEELLEKLFEGDGESTPEGLEDFGIITLPDPTDPFFNCCGYSYCIYGG